MITLFLKNDNQRPYRTDSLEEVDGKYVFDVVLRDGTVQQHSLDKDAVSEVVEVDKMTVKEFWKKWNDQKKDEPVDE